MQLTLFKNPRDVEQIGLLCRQLGLRNTIFEAYKKATFSPIGHLMIDVDSRCSKTLRYAISCSGDDPSVFLYSASQLQIPIEHECKKLLFHLFHTFNLTVRKFFDLHDPKEMIKLISTCIFNVLKREVLLDKVLNTMALLSWRKKTSRLILSRKVQHQ